MKRMALGLSQKMLSHKTDSIVRKLADLEIAENARGQFFHRKIAHEKRNSLVGVSLATINAIEKGKNKRVFLETAWILAKALEIPLSDLILWDDQVDAISPDAT